MGYDLNLYLRGLVNSAAVFVYMFFICIFSKYPNEMIVNIVYIC